MAVLVGSDPTLGIHETTQDQFVHEAAAQKPAVKQSKIVERVEVLCETEIFDDVQSNFNSILSEPQSSI